MTEPTPAVPEHTAPASDIPTVPVQRTDGSGGTHAFDPWSREADTVGVSAADVAAAYPQTATFPQQTAYQPGFESAPVAATAKRRRTPIVLTIAAVLVVLLGAGAYAGVRYYTGAGIKEPESAMPASVTAFARIDVNPGLRDKLAFNNLVKKFPTNGASTEDLIARAETNIATGAGLNYATDVKPWFGGQAGVAEWTNASGDPVALLAFSSTDDAKAKTALAKVATKLGGSFGYVVRDGYALIAGADSGAQANATAASDAATSRSLAGSATYKSAVSHIGGHNLVIAYVDLGKVGSLLSKGIVGLAPGGLDTKGLGLPGAASSALNAIAGGDGPAANPLGGAATSALAKLTGTVIVGGAVVSDGLEIHAHVQGLSGSDSGTSTNVRPTMDSMPSSTTIGLALDGVDPNSAAGKKLPTLLGGLAGGSGQGSSMMSALSGPLMSVITAKVISLSVSGVSGDLPTGTIGVDTRDAASAQRIMTAINQLTSGGTPVSGLKVTRNGTRVQASIGSAGTGKLGATPLYTETMAGMSNETSMGYVDFTKLMSALVANHVDVPSDFTSFLTPIKATGFGATSTGTSSDELIRIVIK